MYPSVCAQVLSALAPDPGQDGRAGPIPQSTTFVAFTAIMRSFICVCSHVIFWGQNSSHATDPQSCSTGHNFLISIDISKIFFFKHIYISRPTPSACQRRHAHVRLRSNAAKRDRRKSLGSPLSGNRI